MVQPRSIIKTADNSGAHRLMVIGLFGNKRFARLGDVVKCSVKSAKPLGMVKKGTMVDVLLVRTKKETRRRDGSFIRFDDNAGVIINSLKDTSPKGTRIFGPVAREIKDLGYNRIVSLAKEVV